MEVANKAVAARNRRRRKDKGGGQHASSSAPANAREAFRAPVGGFVHCGGTHRQEIVSNGRVAMMTAGEVN